MPEVPVEKLRWVCDPAAIPPADVVSPSICELIIGQERALRSLRLGLGIDSNGYNIFVTGMAGTGRNTAVRCLLEEFSRQGEAPPDICYVNNFEHPDQPICLKLPAGTGRAFKKDVERRVEQLRTSLPTMFESATYRERRLAVLGGLDERREAVRGDFRTRFAEKGFALVENRLGDYTEPDVVPIVDGERVDFKRLDQRAADGEIESDEVARLRARRKELEPALDELVAMMKALRREERIALDTLRRETALLVVQDIGGELHQRYPGDAMEAYLTSLREDILSNLKLFGEHDDDSGEYRRTGQPPPRYQVNLLVDNGSTEGRPIVFESAPTFHTLFGMIEKRRGEGAEAADFRDIKAGSLIRASGGYLVLNAADVINDSDMWVTLKRTLRTGKVEIQSYDPYFHFSVSALKPVPIEVDVKVIIVGGKDLYERLWRSDREFTRIFKVVAEFDSVFERKPSNIVGYVGVTERIRREDDLLPVHAEAMAVICEQGVRLAGNQNKLSAQFGVVGDVLREADYWARAENAETIRAPHVWRALEQRAFRFRLFEDKIREEIERGDLLIDTAGTRVGQVNGLTIYDLGFYRFGTAVRITASASIGRAGIINIEAEVGMSGASYNKGVLILAGFIQQRYAHDRPLNLTASLAFEQSYSGVDGDSASSTEIYAMLSALADIPIRQDIAVTGSVNQMGDIQPIGGVNEKIEGFFDICRARGLTGSQGVIIPVQNVQNLQLRPDVVEACRDGVFKVWAVATIDEGVELLTGLEAGVRRPDGSYPPNSVNDRVNATLQRWATTMRDYNGFK